MSDNAVLHTHYWTALEAGANIGNKLNEMIAKCPSEPASLAIWISELSSFANGLIGAYESATKKEGQ